MTNEQLKEIHDVSRDAQFINDYLDGLLKIRNVLELNSIDYIGYVSIDQYSCSITRDAALIILGVIERDLNSRRDRYIKKIKELIHQP